MAAAQPARPVLPHKPLPARNRPRPKIAAARAGRFRRTTPPGIWQPIWEPGGERLDRLDLLGLRALGPPAGRVLDPLVLLKAAVTVNLDGGVVNENVIGAVVWGDETVPLSALNHFTVP